MSRLGFKLRLPGYILPVRSRSLSTGQLQTRQRGLLCIPAEVEDEVDTDNESKFAKFKAQNLAKICILLETIKMFDRNSFEK